MDNGPGEGGTALVCLSGPIRIGAALIMQKGRGLVDQGRGGLVCASQSAAGSAFIMQKGRGLTPWAPPLLLSP